MKGSQGEPGLKVFQSFNIISIFVALKTLFKLKGDNGIPGEKGDRGYDGDSGDKGDDGPVGQKVISQNNDPAIFLLNNLFFQGEPGPPAVGIPGDK